MAISDKIAEREAALRKIDRDIEALRQQRVIVETELRVWKEAQAEFAGDVAKPVRGLSFLASTKRPKNLGPVWRGVFEGMVKNAPKVYSLDEMKVAASAFGEVNDNFRVAAWHHVQRGNLEKLETNEYRANKQTAEAVGMHWSFDEEHGGTTGAGTPAAVDNQSQEGGETNGPTMTP